MNNPIRVCLTCEQVFLATDNRAKYCGTKCRNNSPSKKIRTNEFQQKRREMINAVKLERGCRICGYNAHAAALQFNHIRGDKSFEISRDPKRAWSAVMSEIDKCEVLCANCHRKFHFMGL